MLRLSFALLFSLSLLAAAPQSSSDEQLAGQLLAQDPDGNGLILPLKETFMHLDITGSIVRAEVSQVFYNDSNFPLEAIYTFPLAAKATITTMRLETAGSVTESVVREKEEARQVYESARDSGSVAALLEKKSESVFQTKVANFLPGEEVSITFEYVQPLSFVGDAYELAVPTTFNPRFLPEPVFGTDPILASIGAGLAQTPYLNASINPHRFFLTAEITGLPLANIVSSTHRIDAFEMGWNHFEVELDQRDDIPNRDFQLKMYLLPQDRPQLSLVQSVGYQGVHGLLNVYPPQELREEVSTVPREVVFLVDTSGSMLGESLQQAQSGLKSCLNMLREQDRFNIFRFSDHYSQMSDTFLDASDTQLAKAESYIDTLTSNGGTQMQKALNHVLTLPGEPGFLRMVVFLTDGDVGNGQSLLRLVNSKRGKARLYSFGVGSAPNEHLLRKVSEMGHGVTNFIRNNQDIGEVMEGFFQTVNTPVLTDVNITWFDDKGTVREPESHLPEVMPDLFQGRPIQIQYKYSDYFDGEIVLSGMVNGASRQYRFPVKSSQQGTYPGVDFLYGKAKVDNLMSAYHQAVNPYEQADLRQAVVNLALDYQLVTAFTSRVAVEQQLYAHAAEPAVPARVPLVHKANYPVTATQDVFYLMCGLLLMSLSVACFIRRV